MAISDKKTLKSKNNKKQVNLKKTSKEKKRGANKTVNKNRQKNLILIARQRISDFFAYIGNLYIKYSKHNPHRSFKRSIRRDYVRSYHVPGLFKFNHQVIKFMLRHKKQFLILAVFYTLIGIAFLGMASQEFVTSAMDVISGTQDAFFNGAIGKIAENTLTGLSLIYSGLYSNNTTQAQQIFGIFLLLFVWLATIWMSRKMILNPKEDIKVRDAIYNSGTPIVPLALILMVLALELVPAGFGVFLLTSAYATESFSTGGLAMLVGGITIGLFVLSIYLISSTIMALIIVTLPGMYPLNAIRIASELVLGRRLRIINRIIFVLLLFTLFMIFYSTLVVAGIGFIQAKLSFLSSLPIIPLLLVFAYACVTIYISVYLYMLYRSLIDEDEKIAS